jgi:2-haloacid dehalogenase
MPNMPPALVTFDIFGTIVDWQEGLRADLAKLGISLDSRMFEELLADQERAEKALVFQRYAEIVAWSLSRRLGVPPPEALAIGRGAGNWPLFADARESLRSLMERVPSVALTNSDRIHAEQVQRQLGFELSAWYCAEDIRVYKPAPQFWQQAAQRRGQALNKSWWHVSAYADYDLAPARKLGLTTVFVKRPHARPGPTDKIVDGLRQLVTIAFES